jgi:hypothetical protein
MPHCQNCSKNPIYTLRVYCIASKQRHAHTACHKPWSEFQMSYVEVFFFALTDIGDIVDQN